MTSPLITKREAAEVLGVHLSTVNRMVTKGKLRPHQTIEGEVRAAMYLFRRSDVDRLARKREVEAA